MKTTELADAALDWAVAAALGIDTVISRGRVMVAIPNIVERHPGRGIGYVPFSPSRSWSTGGPYLERDRIALAPSYTVGSTESGAAVCVPNGWRAYKPRPEYWRVPAAFSGPTALVAGLRCLVAARLGDTVDVPAGLAGLAPSAPRTLAGAHHD